MLRDEAIPFVRVAAGHYVSNRGWKVQRIGLDRRTWALTFEGDDVAIEFARCNSLREAKRLALWLAITSACWGDELTCRVVRGNSGDLGRGLQLLGSASASAVSRWHDKNPRQ
jgi:hypothetical protein